METLFSLDAWAKVWLFKSTFVLGFLTTLETALFAVLLSMFLGLIFGLMSTSGRRVLTAIARVYVEFIQNTPLLLQICFLYYAMSFSGHSISIIASGIISIGVYHGAYMSEVIRAGIQSIPRGQFEASASQGFNYIGTMYYIILPQSIKIILPPMVNQVVNLIKNTSCLYIIGGSDLISITYSFVTGSNTGGAHGAAYLVSGLLFFCICFPLSMLASTWENNLKKRERMTVNKAKAQTVEAQEDL